MSTILDLPDVCLVKICRKLAGDERMFHWVNVCRRFRNIYYEYFHNWNEVNDDLVENFGHLIGTADFPLRTVKRIQLSKSKCTIEFLKKLRKFHKEIEEAKLFSFTDEYLAELLPLPSLKLLICIGTYNLRGEHKLRRSKSKKRRRKILTLASVRVANFLCNKKLTKMAALSVIKCDWLLFYRYIMYVFIRSLVYFIHILKSWQPYPKLTSKSVRVAVRT